MTRSITSAEHQLLAVMLTMAVLVAAIPLSAQSVHPLSSNSAIVWNGALWRADVEGARAQWTKIAIPDEVLSPAPSEPESVNFEPDGAIRVFRIEPKCGTGQDYARCSTTIHQALSTDEGKTWQVSRTELSNTNPPMGGVWLCQMVDAQNGWMVLNGDSGASMLPEMLVTTSDGGRTWMRMDTDGRMPIGEDAPQLLIARSPQSASFIVGRLNGSGELAFSRTDDGGQTWSTTTTLYSSLPYGLSGLQNGQRPGSLCFDAVLFKDYDSFGAARTVDRRFCSLDGGMTWLAPLAVPSVPEPSATIGDTGRGLQHGVSRPVFGNSARVTGDGGDGALAELQSGTSHPVFGDAQLGFSVAWGDHKTANWTGDEQPGVHSWREYRLYETRDGGKTWRQAPASITDHYKATDSIQINLTEGPRNSAWLVVAAVGEPSRLFYSADRGATWRLLGVPSEK